MGDSRLGRWRSRLSVLAAATLIATGLGYAAGSPAGAAVSAPALTAPIAGASVSANPIFAWDAVSGATGYKFQLSAASNFGVLLVDEATVATKFTPETQLPNGALYWRVASLDSEGQAGSFSAARSLTNQWSAPTPTAPADGATLAFPSQSAVFTWNPVSGAQKYELQVSGTNTFGSGTDSYETPNTTYSLTAPETSGTTIWWRVRATSGANASSGWSTARSFTYSWASTPTLSTPANGATVVDTDFSWSTVPGAKKYHLQVSPNQDWTNNVTLQTDTVATSYSPNPPLPNGSYYWRVVAVDAEGHAGTYSAARSFTRQWNAAPTAVSPTVGQHVNKIAFSWTASARAAYYDLEVNDGSTTTHCYTNHTSWTPYTETAELPATPTPDACDLATYAWQPGTTYLWRVRGYDRDQRETYPGKGNGVYSGNYRSFVFDPDSPSSPVPASGSVVTPELSWTGVATADHYLVTVVDNNGALAENNTPTYTTSFTPAALDPTAGPFTWSVRAVDHVGLVSTPVGGTFSLATPTTGASLTVTAPASGSTSLRMPALHWSAVTGAATYRVRYWKTAQGSGSATSVDLPYTSYTPPDGATGNTGYSWTVQARDDQNVALATSPTQSFSIGFPSLTLGAGGYLTPTRCVDPTTCATVPDTPTLTWSPVTNATHYRVTIANDVDFTNVVSSYDTEYPALTPRESLKDSQAGHAYFWFVQACTYNGCGPDRSETANQNASTFRKHSDPVSLNTPADSATVGDQVVFDWDDYLTTASAGSAQEPRNYHLEVSTDPNFIDGTLVDDVTVDATRYTATSQLYPDGPLYWRVQAVDNSDNSLTWSETRTVTKVIAKPTNTYPADAATVQNVPYLSWTPMSYAAAYEVQVASNADPNFSDPVADAFSGDTDFAAASPLVGLPADEYTWRVRAVDASGNRGVWSDATDFTLALDPPTLTGPASGSTVRPATALFQWGAVTGAAKYTWQLSTSSSMASPVVVQETQMAAWSPREKIEDGTYYWRVQALDGDGHLLSQSANGASAPSVTFSSVAPTATVATGPPWTVNLPVTVTFDKPVSGVDATSLQVLQAGTTTAPAGHVTVVSSTVAKWVPDAPLVPGQSYDVKLSSAIQDGAGNSLAATTVTRRVYTAVQNGDPTFTEHWDRVSSSAASGASYDVSASSGSTASLAFTGTGVSLVGAVTAAGGYADLYLDGVKVRDNLSFYSRTTAYKRTLWSTTGLSAGAHVLKVVVQGSHPSGATGTKVLIDRFDVAGSPVEQTSSAVIETFSRVSTTAAGGGSYDWAQHPTTGFSGTRAWFGTSLKGTKISVVGFKSTTSGYASIYLDGALAKTVSLRGDHTYKSVLYTSGTLSNTVHTVKVYVNGTTTGAGSTVGIDYITAS